MKTLHPITIVFTGTCLSGVLPALGAYAACKGNNLAPAITFNIVWMTYAMVAILFGLPVFGELVLMAGKIRSMQDIESVNKYLLRYSLTLFALSLLFIGVSVALVVASNAQRDSEASILLLAGISAIAASESVTIWLVVTLRLILNYIRKLTGFKWICFHDPNC